MIAKCNTHWVGLANHRTRALTSAETSGGGLVCVIVLDLACRHGRCLATQPATVPLRVISFRVGTYGIGGPPQTLPKVNNL